VQFEDAPGDRGRNRAQIRNRDFGSRNAGEAGEIGVAAIEEEIQRNKQGSQGSGKTIEGVQTDSLCGQARTPAVKTAYLVRSARTTRSSEPLLDN
jgi:hypothetical protein